MNFFQWFILPRKKWNEEKQNDPVDDCVSANSWWNFWKVSWVISVYPRQETLFRNVKVKTRSGEYDRPITKISVIYRAEGYCDDDQRRWDLMPSWEKECFIAWQLLRKWRLSSSVFYLRNRIGFYRHVKLEITAWLQICRFYSFLWIW